MMCMICGKSADRHHIVSRGAGGTNAEWNILLLCREHHREYHTLGWVRFGQKYPRLYGRIVSARERDNRRTNSREPIMEEDEPCIS